MTEDSTLSVVLLAMVAGAIRVSTPFSSSASASA
jgi:hypothetical protein